MPSEIEILRGANPVLLDDAADWMESEHERHSYARLVDAVEAGLGGLDARPVPAGPRHSWSVAIAVAMAVLVAVSLPYLLFGRGEGDSVALSDPGAFELGAEYVWPDGGLPGTPVDVATAFAIEVLEWTDATVVADPEAAPDGPVWVRLLASGRSELSVLVAPIEDGRRALFQIGSPPSIGFGDPDVAGASWISLVFVPDADTVDVMVRLVGSEQTTLTHVAAANLYANTETLQRGPGAMPQPDDGSPIASVLVLYRDSDGAVIASSGGNFATEEPLGEAASPTAILSDGVVTEAEYRAAALAVADCVRTQGGESHVEVDATGYASFTVRAADGTAEETLSACQVRHLGRVAIAWADQNSPSPERETAFYNQVVDCVEVHTGGDYGQVRAVGDTKATDAAIAAAPDTYNACFEQVLMQYPDLG